MENNIYLNNDYLRSNPSLHEEDSPWKAKILIPLVDNFARQTSKAEINVLDVGGGAGLILKSLSDHLINTYGIKVNKYVIDLSPGMLNAQKQNNPDIIRSLNESINKTSLGDKSIDLALMIDILEHVTEETNALKEIDRIANYAIFKVPLENNLYSLVRNMFNLNEMRAYSREQYGHVNFYSYPILMRKIGSVFKKIISASCANVYDYFLKSPHYNKLMKARNKLFYLIVAWLASRLPPWLHSLVFGDFALILVQCH